MDFIWITVKRLLDSFFLLIPSTFFASMRSLAHHWKSIPYSAPRFSLFFLFALFQFSFLPFDPSWQKITSYSLLSYHIILSLPSERLFFYYSSTHAWPPSFFFYYLSRICTYNQTHINNFFFFLIPHFESFFFFLNFKTRVHVVYNIYSDHQISAEIIGCGWTLNTWALSMDEWTDGHRLRCIPEFGHVTPTKLLLYCSLQ